MAGVVDRWAAQSGCLSMVDNAGGGGNMGVGQPRPPRKAAPESARRFIRDETWQPKTGLTASS